MAKLGADDYRRGARERLQEASVLRRAEFWAGSIYLAGRAVEGILRAMIWKGDPEFAAGKKTEKKTLGTGHDLRDMLRLARRLGVLREDAKGMFSANVQHVARLWRNNMRFWPTAKVTREWRSQGELSGKRTIKQAAQDYHDACMAVIRRCEALWKS